MSEQIPAVVTPLDVHMGLDIARSLGARGIPVYGIDSDPSAPGKYSKYARFLRCPDPALDGGAAYIRFLVEFGKKLARRAVLFPLSDKHVLLCSKEREALSPFYEFVMPDHETVLALTTKNGLDSTARKFDIPAPRTIFIQPEDDIDAVAAKLDYPVVLKPVESTFWHRPEIARVLRGHPLGGRAKIVLCCTPVELSQSYRMIAAYDPRLIVQEVIPGEDHRLVYFSFYMDRNSQPLGIFAGRKCRVIPTGFGSASYARSIVDPALTEAAFHLLRSVGYKGLGGVEFKQDARDGRYKLVEFNTRFGMWDGLGRRCGVDLAYIAYADAIHLAVEPALTYRENVVWIDFERDLRAMLEYRRKKQITIQEWLRSLRGEKMWAVYSRDDWRPGVAYSLGMLRTLAERVIGR
jgi:predicted ATP-grasp superfamily ATP-dependent carboligase